MKVKTSFILLIAFALMSLTTTENEELFKNEIELAGCRQDIPLTYKKKDEIKVAEKANELKDKELILLHYNKQTGSVTFKRYYLISETIERDVYNFLIQKKYYGETIKEAIFLKYTDKYDRFYLADCFDKIVSENAELKTLLKEED